MNLILRIILILIIMVLLYGLFETLEKHPFFSEGEEAEIVNLEQDEDEGEGFDDDDDDVPLRTEMRDGVLVIRLSPEQQTVSGLVTENIQALEIYPEEKCFANVLPIDDLLAAKEKYQLIKAELNILTTAYNASSRVHQRLKVLNDEAANISNNRLEDARAQMALEASRVNKLKLELATQENSMRRKWGKILTHLALHKEENYFQDFVVQEKALLLMTLKNDQSLPAGLDSVFISRSTSRQEAEPALILSSAPHTDPIAQGESFFLQSDMAGLRSGMRLNVWIAKANTARRGVFIPENAVVWHEGLPWAYVKEGEDIFTRKALNKALEVDEGWLANDNFQPGDKLLVQGAQQLLSEEFRSMIPDEDDDP